MAIPKSQTSEGIILTNIFYLVKESKHDEEKPYELAYDAKGIIPETNMLDESHPVLIHSFRPIQDSDSYRHYGFTSAKIDCTLSATEFQDEQVIREVYYPAIEKLLWQSFPEAAAVRIMEHGVRIHCSVEF
jgi:hypothetical protein